MTRDAQQGEYIITEMRLRGLQAIYGIAEETIAEVMTRPHTPAPLSELKEYIESVDLEFAKHFTYASGKEYEIWGTALNRIREIQSRLGVYEESLRTAAQEPRP